MDWGGEDIPSVFFKKGQLVRDYLLHETKWKEGGVYQHQRDVVKKIWESNGNLNPDIIDLAVLPTGTGKSGIIVLLSYVLQPKKVLVITPSLIISKQVKTAFGLDDFNRNRKPGFLEKVKLITNEKDLTTAVPEYLLAQNTSQIRQVTNTVRGFPALTIANAQKFGNSSNVNLEDIPDNVFNMIIVDEAHHYPAATWRNIVNRFKGKTYVIFLTATPLHNNTPIIEESLLRCLRVFRF